jgi:hypothetical protein
MNAIDKIDILMDHISSFDTECTKLGRRLIIKGEVQFGVQLMKNGRLHDQSKFHGIEFDYLWQEFKNTPEFAMAIRQHQMTNPHHPEYWGNIHNMHRIYVAEMVCDWKSRSTQFGTSLMEYIRTQAMPRYQFTEKDPIFAEIAYFASILCDTPSNNRKCQIYTNHIVGEL